MTGAIRADHVSKSYFVRHERRRTLKEQLLRQYAPKTRIDALQDVSFSVEPGETYGIVGANGSGKSTLLKLIAGTARPTTGTVEVQGRVSALLELGAGFHPDFTGRENAYLNASILGLSRKETDRILPSIIDFAELGDFFDGTVKTYSSGMYMRLAFAVAAHVDPDILLIDEILAVGDEYFQRKCFAKLNEFRARGKTICFVSHDLGAVAKLCRKAMLLDRGQVRAEGDIRRVLGAYAQLVEQREEHALDSESGGGDRWGTGEVTIDQVTLHGGPEPHILTSSAPFEIRLDYQVHAPVPGTIFGLTIYRDDGAGVYGTNTRIDGLEVPVATGSATISFRGEHLDLLPGRYVLDVGVIDPGDHVYDYHSKRFTFRVAGAALELGTARIEHHWEVA